jgi:hypothetical protein
LYRVMDMGGGPSGRSLPWRPSAATYQERSDQEDDCDSNYSKWYSNYSNYDSNCVDGHDNVKDDNEQQEQQGQNGEEDQGKDRHLLHRLGKVGVALVAMIGPVRMGHHHVVQAHALDRQEADFLARVGPAGVFSLKQAQRILGEGWENYVRRYIARLRLKG